MLAALVLASSEICMLNSKVSFSRLLLNLVRVSFFQCWSFSSHWCGEVVKRDIQEQCYNALDFLFYYAREILNGFRETHC